MNSLTKSPENKTMFCKKHGFPALEICLYGSPMDGRLLCKICKQNLSREELLEVISLTDFQSGNFMTAIDSMMEQPLNQKGSPEKDSLEKHLDYFYQKLEDSLINIIRNSKENALKAVRENTANASPSFDLEYQRGFVKTKHENVGKNWQENLYDDVMLNDLAENFAELSKNMTTFMSKNSSSNQSKGALIETFKVDGKIVTNFEKMCEKYLDGIVEKLKSTQKEEEKIIIAIEEESKEKEESSTKTTSRQHVTRNKKRIQDIIDKEEVIEKKKKIKSSPDENLSNDGDFVVEINEEASNLYIPRINCTHTILTKHESLSWGGLCYIPSRQHLVSGGFEGSIYVWDIETKAFVYTRNINSKIYKILYIESKDLLLVSSDAGLIHIFDVRRNYALLVSYQAHPKQAFSVAYLSKVDLIASCGEDGNITLWSFNQETNECSRKRTLDTNKRQVSCLCYIEEQNLLVAGMCKGGHIMVFQPDKSKPFRIMKAHNKEKSVDSLVYVAEWKQLISGSEDSYIKFWDFSDLSNPNGPTSLKAIRRDDSFIEAIAVMPEENYLFHTNLDECFSVWDLSSDRLMENIRGHSNKGSGEALIYIKERKELITAFAEEIRIWKVEFYQKS